MRKYLVVFCLFVCSGILTWSYNLEHDKLFVFISSLVSLSMISLFFWWLYETGYALLGSLLSLVGLGTCFMLGLFLYRDTALGIPMGGITFRAAVFWSLYELILMGFFFMLVRNVIRIFKKSK